MNTLVTNLAILRSARLIVGQLTPTDGPEDASRIKAFVAIDRAVAQTIARIEQVKI